MRKRIIMNLKKALAEIKNHPIWEFAPLFPEIHFPKRKSGYASNYFFLCPLAKERHPSCCFDLSSCLIHCFSCGFNGDIIDFYMHLRSKSFFASVIRLAKFLKIKLEWGRDDAFQKRNLADPPISQIADYPNEDEIPF